MRVAFGQQAQVIADELAEIEPGAIFDQSRSTGRQQLDDEHAKLVLEAGAPCELDGVAGLQDRGKAAGAAAADEPEMAASTGDHGLGND